MNRKSVLSSKDSAKMFTEKYVGLEIDNDAQNSRQGRNPTF